MMVQKQKQVNMDGVATFICDECNAVHLVMVQEQRNLLCDLKMTADEARVLAAELSAIAAEAEAKVN